MSTDSTQLRRHVRAHRGLSTSASPLWAIALWDYALANYAHDAVRHACLYLQDEAGVDVCELLWVCWLDRHGLVLDDDADSALQAVRAWQTEVTLPLRGQRRALKARARLHPDIAELRETIKRAELFAERETLARLQALAERGEGIRPRRCPDPPLPQRLAARWELCQKSHLLDLQTLVSQLDPPRLSR